MRRMNVKKIYLKRASIKRPTTYILSYTTQRFFKKHLIDIHLSLFLKLTAPHQDLGSFPFIYDRSDAGNNHY